MLHIFVVNTGTMVTMDMSHTMRSVLDLQRAIQEEYGIAVEKQVLLVSGGQSLDVQQRVCSFNAGTDTSPIYMFDKSLIEQATYQSTSLMEDDQQPPDSELKVQVEAFRNLPPSYHAVISRTQMALQLHDRAKEKVQSCENVVRDQHQQQQGWMAVVANLEDISRAFYHRANSFEVSLTEFMSKRDDYFKMLSEFPDVLGQLERIPLPPCLVDSARLESESDRDSMTLMRWISRQDQRSSLVNMYQQCAKSLEQFEPNTLEIFRCDINDVIAKVNNPGMKEIKGLGDRLFGLEQLLAQAKKTRQDQGEMAQGFVQNQTRISNLKDTSVLPQLCDSHQKQLVVMIKNHLQLREISRRCLIAKGELCQNLHVRLRWIMFVEQQITGIHSKMVVYHENLKRLKKRLEITNQVYNAPRLFAKALVEIYLRRNFETQFSQQFGAVSELQLKEVDRRKEFSTMMDAHFLNALFPGLTNLPPTIMLEPLVTDTILPTVTLDDIKLLKDHVPELNNCLYFPVDGLSKETQTVDIGCLEEPEDELSKSQSEHLSQLTEQMKDKAMPHTANEDEGTCLSTDVSATELVTNTDKAIEESVETLKNEPLEDYIENEHALLDDVGPLSMAGMTIGTHSNLKIEPPFGSFFSADNFLSTKDSVEMPFYSLAGAQLQPYQAGPLLGIQDKLETLEDEIEDLKRENKDKERKLDKYETLEVEIENRRKENQDKERKLKELQLENEDLCKTNICLEKVIGDSKKVLLVDTDSIKSEVQIIKADFGCFIAENTSTIAQVNSFVEHITNEYERIKLDNSNLLEEISQIKEENQTVSVFQNKYECLLEEHEEYKKTREDKYEEMEQNMKEREGEFQKILQEKQQLEKDIENVTKELLADKDLQIQNKELLVKELKESQQNVERLTKCLEDVKEEHHKSLQKVKKTLTEQVEVKKQEIIGLKLSQEVEISELKLIIKERDDLLQQQINEKNDLLQNKEQEKKQEINELVIKLKSEKVKELIDFEKRLRRQWDADIQTMSVEELIAIKPEIQSPEKVIKDKEVALGALTVHLEESHKKKMHTKLEELEKKKDEEIAIAKQKAHQEVEELLTKYETCEHKYHALQKESVMQTSQMEASFMTEKHSEVLAAVEEERKKHKLKMDKLRRDMEEARVNAIQEVLEKAEAQHSQEIQEMMRTFDEEKKNSLDEMKTSIQADKQVHFNTALSKVSVEKDKEIEMLRRKISEFENQHKIDKEAIDKLLTENCDISDIIKLSIVNKETENNRLKEENESLLKTNQDLVDKYQQARSGGSSMEESVIYMQKSGPSDSSSLEDQASGGHRLVKAKENTDIRKKMLESSGSRAEKISIIDINVGDLVLIFFEEPHDNYVVFTRGHTHYFVHADSLIGLGLKPHDPSKRAWIIGRITDKEYCQAKKAQNRFKVPVGTKFYRVKAEPCSIREHRRTKAETKT